jgi:hypothetical protein
MAEGTITELPVTPVAESEKPVVKRACSNCVHGALGQYGVYCTMFNEWVVDEAAVAAECIEFKP